VEWEKFNIVRLSTSEMGGRVNGPFGFAVKEVILPHHICPEPIAEPKKRAGSYTLGVLAKWGVDTLTAVNQLSAVVKSAVSYAGLKDALAVTSQYVSLRGQIDKAKVIGNRWAFTRLGSFSKPLDHDYLWGNRFDVEVIGYGRLSALDDFLSQKPFPNFFGPQRFGVNPPYTHELGMAILRGEEPEELVRLRPPLRNKIHELAIQAYQSYLFNAILRERIERGISLSALERGDLVAPLNVFGLPAYSQVRVSEGGRLKKDQVLLLPVPGSRVKGPGLDLAEKVAADLGAPLPRWVNGWYREASMSPLSPSYRLRDKRLYLTFELRKAQYASVLIHELIGGEDPVPVPTTEPVATSSAIQSSAPSSQSPKFPTGDERNPRTQSAPMAQAFFYPSGT